MLTTQTPTPAPKADTVKISEIGNATYDVVQDWINIFQSAGIINGLDLTNSRVPAELDVSAGTGFIKITDDCLAETKSFDYIGTTNVTLASGKNYVYMDFNGGIPHVEVTSNESTIERYRQFTLGIVYKDGSTLHLLSAGVKVCNIIREIYERTVEKDGYTHISGATTSETGTLNLGVTAGVWYRGLNRLTTDALDTSVTDTFVYQHYGTASWITDNATASAVDCTHYNDDTDTLGSLTVNAYGVQWVYITADSHLHVIYGTENGSLANAEAATPPTSLPDYISTMGKLIAKIIVRQTGVIVEIQITYGVKFSAAGVPDHDDTGNISGGLAGDRQHLATSQVAEITANTLKITAGIKPTLIRLFGGSGISSNDQTTKAVSGADYMILIKYPYFFNVLHNLLGNCMGYETMLDISDNKRYGSNSARPGSTMTSILTATPSFSTIINSMTETHALLVLGTGDCNEDSITLTTLKSRWEAVNDIVLAAGKVPIWMTVLPRNAVDGANDWSSSGIGTANRRKLVAAFNNFMMKRCRELGLFCSDWHSVLMAADGQAVTDWTSDGLHHNRLGGYPLAQKLIYDVGHLLPQAKEIRDIYDVYDSTYNIDGNVLNGALAGTGGATSDGGGTGTITGTIPDNLRLSKPSTTTSCVAAIVARTDGLPGNVLELTFTCLGTGSANESWTLAYWSGSTENLASYGSSGEYLQMGAELEFEEGHGIIGKGIGCSLANNAAVSNSAKTTISFNATTKKILDSGNGFGSFLANRLAVVSGAGEAGNNSVFEIDSASAGELQLSDDAVLTTESAGATVTVLIPRNITRNYGVFSTLVPDVTTPAMYEKSAILQMPHTDDVLPKIQMYINGTETGTLILRIANPWLRKVTTLPTVCTFEADDTTIS